MVAAGITGGKLTLERAGPLHLAELIRQLAKVGVEIEVRGAHRLEVSGTQTLRAADLTTQEYPGFPTDMQAQYMALVTQAVGSSVISETIFENRFLHALELSRMGAEITVEGRKAIVHGRTPLMGANVQASDLRASASLVLAGLAAEGETLIDRVYHIDRGYERIEEKLRRVGARIRRISET
jgi:UDP-N-acetylglucosamine 1-carboxyvinyltransferase